MKRAEDIHICVNSSDGTHSVERTIPLAERGFKISFLAHTEFDRVAELRNYNNITVYLLNDIKPHKKHLRYSIYTKLIKNLNPDLIIVHFCGYDRFHSAIFSNIKPLVGILMGGDVDTHNTRVPLYTYLELKFTKLFLPYVDLLASKTNKIVKILENWKLKGKVVHIPWGVKISEELKVESLEFRVKKKEEKKKELRIELGLPPDKFLVLSNRNVAEPGRQMEILKGFHELVKEGLNVYLLIVVRISAISYLTKINEYINENNLCDSVKIFEYIPQVEMLKYYTACDVLVSNWVHDGMPQTFFEASLRGLPIIMNELVQYKDYYEDKISALLNDGTSTGFSKNMKLLYDDEDLRMLLAENGRKVILEQADFDKWADYFIDELLALMKSGKKIKIPYIKLMTGKILILIMIVSRRWPFKKIMVWV